MSDPTAILATGTEPVALPMKTHRAHQTPVENLPAAATTYHNVTLKGEPQAGRLVLSSKGIAYYPAGDGQKVKMAWSNVANATANKASSAKALLRIFHKKGRFYQFAFENRDSMMQVKKDIARRQGGSAAASVSSSDPPAAASSSFGGHESFTSHSAEERSGSLPPPMAVGAGMQDSFTSYTESSRFHEEFANNKSNFSTPGDSSVVSSISGSLRHNNNNNNMNAMIPPVIGEEQPGNGEVHAVVQKPTPSSSVGLGLKKEGGGIVIDNIKEDSLFRGQGLQPGMTVLTINGVDCRNMSVADTVVLLKRTTGRVAIVATNETPAATATPSINTDYGPVVTALITKPTPTASIGLSIVDRTMDNKTMPVILDVKLDGLCANTSLQKNMGILSINGVACHSRNDCIALLQQAGQTVEIVAGPSHDVFAVTVRKPSPDARVGISIRKQGAEVVVDKVSPTGLFAATSLKPEMRVTTINGDPLEHLTMEQIMAMIKDAPSMLTLVAANPKETQKQEQARRRQSQQQQEEVACACCKP